MQLHQPPVDRIEPQGISLERQCQRAQDNRFLIRIFPESVNGPRSGPVQLRKDAELHFPLAYGILPQSDQTGELCTNDNRSTRFFNNNTNSSTLKWKYFSFLVWFVYICKQ